MVRHRGFRRLGTGLGVLVFLLLTAGQGRAAESPREFLDALRENGYFDEAVTYLELKRSDPRASATFQEIIDYELGVTLIGGARATTDAAQRDRWLSDANERLTRFLADRPHHPLASSARTELAELLVDRGRIEVERAARLAGSSPERAQRTEAARELFRKADNVLLEMDKQTDEALKKFLFIAARDVQRNEARDQLRREQLQARLARSWVLYEMAQTWEPGSQEQKAALVETAGKFGELYAKHREQLGGFYARLGQGRCYKDLGDARRAFAMFEELLAVPDDPEAFRTMKGKAAVQALETALMPDVKKVKEGFDIAEKWAETARPADAASEEGLAIRYLGAEAARAYAETLGGGSEQAKLRQHAVQWARDSYATVAGVAGRYQAKAKIGLLDPSLGAAPAREPATFSEARDRAKAALDRMAAAEADERTPSSGRSAEERHGCRRRAETASDEAMKYCRLAMKLGESGAAAEDLGAVRYNLAYLCFRAGDMREAAALGERLAKGDDRGAAAREGAMIALAAYAAMFRASPAAEDRPWAGERMLGVARTILERWGTQPEADEARLVLLQAAAGDGRLDQARQYLEQIPIGSPRRGEAESSIGRAIWTAYRRAVRMAPGGRPPQAELAKMMGDAEHALTEGVERTRKLAEDGSPVAAALAADTLALAQINLEDGHPYQAIEWLEDPKVGAKTLVDAQNPLAQLGGLAVETYKLALQAYIAARQEDKAQQALDDLEKAVRKGGDSEVAKRLTLVASSLGGDLQAQVEQFRVRGKTDPLAKLQQAEDAMLSRVSGEPGGKAADTFFRLQWVAESYFGIGAGLDPGGAKPSPEAEKQYRRAARSYRALLARCEAEAKFAPTAEAVTAVRVRLARCLRRLGQYREALSLLLSVLKEHTTMVDAQAEAAYTYQAWGDEKPECVDIAIQGSKQYREIWGWGELSRRVESAAQFQDMFFEARYNLALCRFRQARAKSDPGESDRLLQTAENEILVLRRLYPDMGGRPWQDKYDDLLRQIRKFHGGPSKNKLDQ